MRGVGRGPTYSEEQRKAAVAAYLGGMDAGDVAQAAAAGELNGLEPFQVAETSVRAWTQETQRQALKDAAEEARLLPDTAADIYVRFLAVLAEQLGRLEQESREGTFSRDDYDRMRALARAFNEIAAIARRAKKPDVESPEPTAPEPSEEARRLLASHRAEQNGHRGEGRAGSNGNAPAGDADTKHTTTEKDNAGGVHGHANGREGSARARRRAG